MNGLTALKSLNAKIVAVVCVKTNKTLGIVWKPRL
jgi:hypothetical protein